MELRYNSNLSLTSALDGGWMVKATSRPPYPRERDPIPIAQEAGWASRLVRRGAENLASAAIQFPNRPARSESLYQLRYPGR